MKEYPKTDWPITVMWVLLVLGVMTTVAGLFITVDAMLKGRSSMDTLMAGLALLVSAAMIKLLIQIRDKG